MANVFSHNDRRILLKAAADVQTILVRLDALEAKADGRFDAVGQNLAGLAETLEVIRKALLDPPGPAQPGPFGEITLVSERTDEMSKRLQTYHVNFPTAPPDVVTQRLGVESGSDSSDTSFPASVTAADIEVPGGPGAPDVTLTMAHVDAQGDEGPVKTQTFQPTGTILPTAPGDFGGIVLESERIVDDDVEPNAPVAH